MIATTSALGILYPMNPNHEVSKSDKPTSGLPESLICRFITLPIAAIILLSTGCTSEKKPNDYNIIYIMVDALRPDHLGCYGYERNTSPWIDELADRSSLFLNAYSPATYTLPSVASIFTSRHALDHRTVNPESYLDDAEITLAEILKFFGYRTAAFVSGVLLNHSFNLDQGFDLYVDISNTTSTLSSSESAVPQDSSETVLSGRGTADEEKSCVSAAGSKLKKCASEVIPEALEWLGNNRDDKFFLFLHLMEVHPPLFLQDESALHLYDPSYAGIVDSLRLDLKVKRSVYRKSYRTSGESVGRFSDKDISHVIAHYDACLTYLDSWLAWFDDELEAIGLREKTILVLSADHGIDMFDHNTLFLYTPQAPYEELIHVPLIIDIPGKTGKGMVIDETVQLIDLVPTLLDLLGLPNYESAEGRSLLPLIRNDEKGISDDVVWSLGHPERNPALKGFSLSLTDSDWKLIARSVFQFELLTMELYNLRDDPYERANLIYENLPVKEAMVVRMNDFLIQKTGKSLLEGLAVPNQF